MSVIETGDFGVKVKIGDKGPSTIIKKSDLALRKSDAMDRWARNDKLDASITNIDTANYKINLSIESWKSKLKKKQWKNMGLKILALPRRYTGKALGRDKKEE